MTAADLHERIAELAEIDSDHPGGGLIREVYTSDYDRAVDYVCELMRDAGLAVRLDAAGNLFGEGMARVAGLGRLVAVYAENDTITRELYEMATALIEGRPEIVEVRMSMPNRHHFLVDLAPFGLENPNEIFPRRGSTLRADRGLHPAVRRPARGPGLGPVSDALS